MTLYTFYTLLTPIFLENDLSLITDLITKLNHTFQTSDLLNIRLITPF